MLRVPGLGLYLLKSKHLGEHRASLTGLARYIAIAQVHRPLQYSMSEHDGASRGKRPLDDDGSGEKENSSDEEHVNPPKPIPPRNQYSMWNPFSFMKRSSSTPIRDKKYWQNLPLEEKRKHYKCKNRFITVDEIKTWPDFFLQNPQIKPAKCPPVSLPISDYLNNKVSILQGDITTLEIDAIVNAANTSLMGGGGVDGAIHSAAGYSLRDECEELGGCDTGFTKITSGHRLPAKYILHTVGPFNNSPEHLKSCYTTCFDLVKEHSLRTVAFCCVATGVYGFPNEQAADIALKMTRQWLESDNNHQLVDRIIFVVFLKKDYKIYTELMQKYFPLENHKATTPHDKTTPPNNKQEDSSEPTFPTLMKSVTAPLTSRTTSAKEDAKTEAVKKNVEMEEDVSKEVVKKDVKMEEKDVKTKVVKKDVEMEEKDVKTEVKKDVEMEEEDVKTKVVKKDVEMEEDVKMEIAKKDVETEEETMDRDTTTKDQPTNVENDELTEMDKSTIDNVTTSDTLAGDKRGVTGDMAPTGST